MTLQLKRNDIGDVLGYTLVNEDGSVVDLTGSTVKFYMGNLDKVITNATATIVDAKSGEVEYTFAQEDTLYAGKFKAEFEVTFANGKIKTYPEDGYLIVNIQPNVNNGKSTQLEEDIALTISQVELFKNEVNTKIEDFENEISKVVTDVQSFKVTLDTKTDKTVTDQLSEQIGIVKGINSYTASYFYNADGSVQSVTVKDAVNNIVSTTWFTYLSNGDVDTSTLVQDGQTVTTKYNYDANGNVQSIVNTKVGA